MAPAKIMKNTKSRKGQRKEPSKKNILKVKNQEKTTQETFCAFDKKINEKKGLEIEGESKKGDNVADKETEGGFLFKDYLSWNIFKNPRYTGRLPNELIIGGPTLKFDLNRDIKHQRKRIEERYKMIYREDNERNPGMAERIRNMSIEDLIRHRQQMEAINWQEFFKDVEIPWPAKPTIVKPPRISDEERDAHLYGR